jgi:hypothetical protein
MVFKTKLSSVLHFSNINLPCISLESLSRCHLVYQMAILVVFSSKETESLCSFFRPVQHSLWILPNSFLWRPKMITKTSLSIWHTFHSYWCPVSDTPDYSLSHIAHFPIQLLMIIHQGFSILHFLFTINYQHPSPRWISS